MDYISRNGAKVALAKMRSDYDFDYNAIVDKCINRLMQLPIYRQEQKVGKWHWIEERTYMQCLNCHDIWHYEENQTERFKFCPHCGAKMEGADNE